MSASRVASSTASHVASSIAYGVACNIARNSTRNIARKIARNVASEVARAPAFAQRPVIALARAKKSVIALVILSAALLLAPACGPTTRPGISPRHLVLVTVEGLRTDALGAYLQDRPTTSLASDDAARKEGRAMGLDDLASAGVVFARCMAPSPRTMPSLASLMTSRSPIACGVTRDDEGVPDDVPTLPEIFDAAGFQTGAFVTSTTLDLHGAFGRGFVQFRKFPDDATTLAAAMEWMKRDQGDGSRRFLWIHLAGPTELWDEPIASRPDVDEILAKRDFGHGLDASERRQLATGSLAPDARRMELLRNDYDRAVARTAITLSLALRSGFDYYAPGAEESETWARTVLALTSPCGTLLGEDGAVGRGGTLHNTVLRVPLFLRHPDSLTGERIIGDVVELADLLPTFVEWFDLPSPEHVQGRSLLARLDSWREAPFPPRIAVAALPEGVYSARDERFHMVWNPLGVELADRPAGADSIGPIALYEPYRDPHESRDVAAQHPDVVRALQAAVTAWRDAQPVHDPASKRILAHPHVR